MSQKNTHQTAEAEEKLHYVDMSIAISNWMTHIGNIFEYAFFHF